MNIRIFSFFFLSFLLVSCVDSEIPFFMDNQDPVIVNPNNTILIDRKWSRINMPNGLSTGSLQGAAFTLGKMYQFRNATIEGNHVLTYDIYDTNSNTWSIGSQPITCVPESHAGSACFASIVMNTYFFEDKMYYCTLPFVYFTGHYNVIVNGKSQTREIIDVVDIENSILVKQFTFPNRTDDAIAAFDFENNRVWILGYEQGVIGMSPYVIEEYEVDLTAEKPSKIHFDSKDVLSTTRIGGPNMNGIQETIECGTLQDVCFNNGYIYIVTGRGSSFNITEWVKIHEYDTFSQKIVNTIVCADSSEPEGLIYDGNDFFITTVNKTLWKLSNREEYDASINFDSASEISENNYEISTASQLLWFLGQVYSGRTTINGKLVSDIDMQGLVDPFTFYVYDTNIADGVSTTGRKFESHYAYRGTFDGNSHSIVNFNISNTPYYNNGLFPYAVDATIKNLTVSGSIKLSKAEHSEEDLEDIKNVGLIGYMNGGTLENVNVSKLIIDYNGVTNYANIGKLVGSENGNIVKSGCRIE